MSRTEPLDEELSRRGASSGEHRVPPAAAVIVAGVTYGLLPESVLFAPRIVIPVIESLLLAALVATNPIRLVNQSTWSRVVSAALDSLVLVSNLVALGL